ncbi:MAG: twin-arginine translocation signal domain-containing protein, partial [Bryobacteraceae bacterium]
MSNDQFGKTTRRDFLGTATAATALTLSASPSAEAQTAPIKSDEIQVAQLATTGQGGAPAATATPDWTKPAAMAIPKEGYFKSEQGRYGPIYPRTPANYGFTIIAKVKPGKEDAIREYGKLI